MPYIQRVGCLDRPVDLRFAFAAFPTSEASLASSQILQYQEKYNFRRPSSSVYIYIFGGKTRNQKPSIANRVRVGQVPGDPKFLGIYLCFDELPNWSIVPLMLASTILPSQTL